MAYTVGEMARLLGVPSSTLRYYEKEGLLPAVERSAGGIRLFHESDFEWLQLVNCLKQAGMSIKDIRAYIQLTIQGDETISQRLELFYRQREEVNRQMERLQATLDRLEYKCWFYETAQAAGTTHISPEELDALLPDHLRPVRDALRTIPEECKKEVCG